VVKVVKSTLRWAENVGRMDDTELGNVRPKQIIWFCKTSEIQEGTIGCVCS
jgi:hypothetical protein